MEDPLMFFVFLIGMTTSNGICFILYKYQRTISPVNQNIINKLNIFCIYCLNLINSTQVQIKILLIFSLNDGLKGVSILARTSFGPINNNAAWLLR